MSRVLPILFNTEMVRAILDERKTVTRRVIKGDVEGILNSLYHKEHPEVSDRVLIKKLCRAPYQIGDILYVRETWQYLYELDGNEQIIDGTGRYYYAASDAVPFDTYVDSSGLTRYKVPWHPSIHMPKQAARIWLKVTDVRVERLLEATSPVKYPHGKDNTILREGFKRTCDFIDCWNSTIKKQDLQKYGWDANPWVWVIEFERCGKPESEG